MTIEGGCNMTTTRIGNQNPTQSVILNYKKVYIKMRLKSTKNQAEKLKSGKKIF